jgi:enoyl-CoA hydratase
VSEEGRTHLTVNGAVAQITFDRPSARNAMTWRMYDELAEACERIAGDPALRVVVLRGAGGKAFVAGTDIGQFLDFSSGEDGLAYEARIETFVAALETLPLPTVAVIEGWAVGGGFLIANACDLRLATPGARFGVPIAATLGNCISAANLRRLTASLGEAWVKRMLLLAEMPTAEELLATGYVAAVIPPQAMEERLEAVCQKLAGHAPLTMRAAKEALRRLGTDPKAPDDDLVRMCYGSADFREGVSAFVGKRRAGWRGA